MLMVGPLGVSRGRRVAGGAGGGGGEKGEKARLEEARLVYELLRGVTPASIVDICWTPDGLWCGLVSDKATLRKSLRLFCHSHFADCFPFLRI
jgi:hypothetical protein